MIDHCLRGIMIGALGLVACLLAGTSSATAEQKPPPPLPASLVEHAITHDGGPRYFLEHRSESLAERPAVVIDLHGGNGGMRRAFWRKRSSHHLWLRLADEHGFLLLVPNGTNRVTGDPATDRQGWRDLRPSWKEHPMPVDDVGFLTALADWAIAERGADARRIYLVGASNGGMMTMRLLIERPLVFAAGAAFVAALPVGQVPLPVTARPILMVNGTADHVVPWAGGPINRVSEPVLSSRDTLEYWLHVHWLRRLRGEPPLQPDRQPDDDCRLASIDFGRDLKRPSVRYIEMVGAGHWVPTKRAWSPTPKLLEWLGPRCREVDGPVLAWTFLSQHRLP